MNRPAAVAMTALLAACRCGTTTAGPAPETPRDAVVVTLAYGSEKKSWLEEQARLFAATSPRTKDGKPIRLEGKAMGSGEAVQGILNGSLQPTVFSPASGAYVTLLNQAWLSVNGHAQPVCPPGDPVVLSPIVIAMWRPMAEALGWPQKQLGWKDLLAVNADPRGWGALGHPEWGNFKLGHTQPELSNSGLLAVLAEAYAGAKKARGLDAADLEQKATRTFVKAVEATIVHYGKSTGFFAEKMLERGPAYLSAAVLYENLVIESYQKPGALPVVAIYPVEGTFWSDHPWAVLDAPWVTPAQREAAGAFLAFLKARPAQERALQLGFRPDDAGIPVGSPVDAAHGVDAKQPQNLLEVPAAPVLQKLIALWQTTKRPADVALVFDKSGSMVGRPLSEAKAGAKTFIASLHPADQVSLIFFDHEIEAASGPWRLDRDRAEVEAQIDATKAGGGTALYQTTWQAFDEARARAAKDPSRIHAVVVMTDGRDSANLMTLDELRARLSRSDGTVKVFTIAYGDDADPKILGQIAEAASGQSVKGSAADIVQVYQDMASFF